MARPLSTAAILTCILAILGVSVGWAQDVTTLEIGAKAPDFSLPGVDDKTYGLQDFADAKVLVVIFTCNHCPTAQAYESRIMQLHADYRRRGVALVAISPNDPQAVRLDELGYTDLGDSLEDMKIRARDQGFTFPYLYDGETQETSRAFGVRATPQVFIFDADRRLRYVGRIDDSEVKEVTSHDARNAIEALLSNQPVPVATTRVFGCSTKWADKRADAAKSLAKWDAEPVDLKLIEAEALKKVVQNDTDKYVLVNVWATWCVPCVAELPELVTMHRMYRKRNFQLVTISADDPEQKDAALKVLQEKHASSTNYLFNSDNRDLLFDTVDAEWEGAIPYTILIAPGGKVVYRKHGSFEPLELRKTIADHLGRTYANR